MTRTFLDSGVLIAAARGTPALANRAMSIIDDSNRSFLASDFVRLEVLPKSVYHKNSEEAEFYETYFAGAERMISSSKELVDEAYEEARATGLSAVDALHVAAAKSANAEEFITTEKPTKPLFRVNGVTMRSLQDD